MGGVAQDLISNWRTTWPAFLALERLTGLWLGWTARPNPQPTGGTT